MVALDRWSAPFTAASLLSSMLATSSARKPSTSRSSSTARGQGGRHWRAATKASAIVSSGVPPSSASG